MSNILDLVMYGIVGGYLGYIGRSIVFLKKEIKQIKSTEDYLLEKICLFITELFPLKKRIDFLEKRISILYDDKILKDGDRYTEQLYSFFKKEEVNE